MDLMCNYALHIYLLYNNSMLVISDHVYIFNYTVYCIVIHIL